MLHKTTFNYFYFAFIYAIDTEMYRLPHNVIMEKMRKPQQAREFARLKRSMLLYMKNGQEVPEDTIIKMKKLDAWLSENNPKWRPYFAEKEQ